MEGEYEKVFNVLSNLEDTNKNYNEIQTTNLPEKNPEHRHKHRHTTYTYPHPHKTSNLC